MKLGYLAVNEQTGQTIKLTKNKHPRKQLLEKFGVKHCAKMYVDTVGGQVRHCGYIVGRQWLNLFEVHSWEGK